MSLIGDIILPQGGNVFPYTIDYSALFDGVTDYLSYTPSVSGNTQKGTIHASLKTGSTISINMLTAVIDTNNYTRFWHDNTSNQFRLIHVIGGVAQSDTIWSFVLADPTGHYSITLQWDTVQAVASDRQTLEINGVEIPPNAATEIPQNTNLKFWDTVEHRISRSDNAIYSEEYLSNFYGLDGQALPASTWGEQSALVSGLWIPKDPGSLTYGTNGFHLDFANAVALGTDISGQGNDWSVTGTPAQTVDTPTNNHCTLNPVDHNITGTISNGNLTVSGGVATVTMRPSSGQWYYEKDGVGVSYDADVSGQFNPTLTAGTYNFGATAWSDTGPTGTEKAINSDNMPNGDYVLSGGYTGNGTAYYEYTGGTLQTLTIGGNTYDNDGTDSAVVLFYANGFKLISATDNANATPYTWTGTLKYEYKTSNAQSN